MDTEERLWKTIGRFDLYLSATNTKAALISAFNTFVLGGLVLKWTTVLALFNGNPTWSRLGAFLLVVVAVAALISLLFAFTAMVPFLESPQKPGEYHSLIFFQHVAQHQSAEDYSGAFHSCEDADLTHDLACQAHSLATGARKKYRALVIAVRVTAFGVIGVLLGMALLKILMLIIVG